MSTKTLRVNLLTLQVAGRTLVRNLSFEVAQGEAVGIVGPSGSGKTTLLRCLAGISLPQNGDITIDGTELSSLHATTRSRLRLTNIGMVFQFGGLLPELSVLSNVALPLQLGGHGRRSAENRARETLDSVGMSNFEDRLPVTLSGGEIQRVGIARAMVGLPTVIVADEPTGALDQRNSELITDLLKSKAKDGASALIVATHDPLVYEKLDRIIDLREYAPDPDAPSTRMSSTQSMASAFG